MAFQRHGIFFIFIGLLAAGLPSQPSAQPAGRIAGRVTDETGGALPGVTVELRSAGGSPLETITAAGSDYAFENVPAGMYDGVNDIHSHPAVPRTARLGLVLSFLCSHQTAFRVFGLFRFSRQPSRW